MFPTKKGNNPLEFETKEWFIIVENQQEGPYSLLDLKKDYRFTPDTLVWKKGLREWTPARFVLEMQEIFKDDHEPKALHEPEKRRISDLGQQNQVTLTMQQDPYQLLLWILLILLILFYTFYQLNH
jgi:hypothetical protein